MTREEYAEMLHEISSVKKNGGDVSVCIAKYRQKHKYVYVYNDTIIKVLLGDSSGKKATMQFINAALNLEGSNSVSDLTYVDPSVQGGPFVKNIVSDIVAVDQRNDRVVLEIQHVDDDTYSDRVVFYVARHTSKLRSPGDKYVLQHLNLISLQMFDSFEGEDYRHCIQLRNQNHMLFNDKQTVTLVEVEKFRKGNYSEDDSSLARWLRLFNDINNEVTKDSYDNPNFEDLKNRAKLCNFDDEFFTSEAESMSDREYELYVGKKHARAEGLAEGRAEGRAEGHTAGVAEAKHSAVTKALQRGKLTIEEIAEDNEMSIDEVLKIQGEMKSAS